MNKNRSRASLVRRLLFTLLCVVLVVVWYGGIAYGITHRRGILDWAILENYTPPPVIASLATQDSLTAAAQRILYVNQPAVQSAKPFTQSCSSVVREEQSIVLGCYLSDQAGIYVLQVTDARLNGVEQVTAAHEMLHAAYDRLSGSERTNIDAMLYDYYQHGLKDQRIMDTIDMYKKTEPNDVVNEMHSIFGTEIAVLPAPLEQYYAQYFTDRSKVTGYAADYQAEFTGRKVKIAAYDEQLKTLKQQIDVDEASLDTRGKQLTSSKQSLNSLRASNVAAYNAAVPGYNAQVDAFNGELAITKQLITQYNAIVAARNAIVLEEQQLTSELRGAAIPTSLQ